MGQNAAAIAFAPQDETGCASSEERSSAVGL
jgi:hypothetical protein